MSVLAVFSTSVIGKFEVMTDDPFCKKRFNKIYEASIAKTKYSSFSLVEDFKILGLFGRVNVTSSIFMVVLADPFYGQELK